MSLGHLVDCAVAEQVETRGALRSRQFLPVADERERDDLGKAPCHGLMA